MSEWKEYITIENLTLVVGIVTLLVTYLSYRYMRKSEKRNARNLLECKEAYKKELELWDKLGVGSQDIKERMAKRASVSSAVKGRMARRLVFRSMGSPPCVLHYFIINVPK